MSEGNFNEPPREAMLALHSEYSEFLDKLFAGVAVIDVPLKGSRFQKMFHARLAEAQQAAKKWAMLRVARQRF